MMDLNYCLSRHFNAMWNQTNSLGHCVVRIGNGILSKWISIDVNSSEAFVPLDFRYYIAANDAYLSVWQTVRGATSGADAFSAGEAAC